MQKEEKWAKPIDWIVWAILLVVMFSISAIMYDMSLSKYAFRTPNIRLASPMQNVPQIIEEVNKLAKIEDDSFILTDIRIEIPGDSGTFEQANTMDLTYTLRSKQIIGYDIEKIYYSIDMTNNRVTSVSRLDRLSYMDEEITNVNAIKIQQLIDKVAEKVDLKSMAIGYRPLLIFNIEASNKENEVWAEVSYYKALDNDGFDSDSQVVQDVSFILSTD